MTASKIYAIVNADDFGQSAGVNRGIIQAHERGVLTSASLMVRWPFAGEAASYALRTPTLGVGLHLDLGEWALRCGEWMQSYHVVDEHDPAAVQGEVANQLEGFRQLTGRNPTHIDSHQHRHNQEPVRSAVLEAAAALRIPVRGVSTRYCGSFYGQDEEGISRPELISVEGLLRTLQGLAPGVTEICCHPAADVDLDTMYRSERLTELATLCDPRVREAFDQYGITLITFERLDPFPDAAP